MTTARQIIKSALTFRLNRLGPGETLDNELAATCLTALNELADTWSGQGAFLYREILSAGVCNGTSGTLGTTWPDLSSGQQILGASVSYGVGQDIPLGIGTMAQYQAIVQKATASIPQDIYPDGGATVYFYPAAAGQTITLRTRESFSQFTDLDTDYTMPQGYKGNFGACLAEMMAPVLLGAVTPSVEKAAIAARNRMAAQTTNPAILNTGKHSTGNILTGFN